MAFLSGIRVADITYGLAGPLATQIIVDAAAEVVRVDKPGAKRSPGDLVRLRGQRSIAIDLAKAASRPLVEALLAQSDVLITEPAIDGRDPAGMSYADMEAVNPRLIWCRITGYGDEGPMAGAWAHDHLVAARYGVYDQPGYRDGPTFVTGNVPSLGAALLAVQAIGTALYQREKTGRGQEVGVSLLAGALAFQPTIVSASIDPAGGNPPPLARRPGGATPFYSIYECADGRYLQFGCLTPQFRRNATGALGIAAELDALGFETPAGRDNNIRIIELVADRMRAKSFDEWAAIFEAADVPYAPAQWTEDLLDNEQVAHEDLLVEIDDPRFGPMGQMGATYTVQGESWSKPSAAPLVGQHTDAICAELGLGVAEIAELRRGGVIA